MRILCSQKTDWQKKKRKFDNCRLFDHFMKHLFFLLITASTLYLVLLLAVYYFQVRMVFQSSRLPAAHHFTFEATFEEHIIHTEDGEQLNTLFFPAAGSSKGVILYLHGNRGTLERWATHHQTFNGLGYDFFIFDYRGYGKSTGKPSESGLYQDAEAAYQWLLKRYQPEDITIYGRSLGTGVATYLAKKHQARQLILETPYHSMPCVIRAKALLPLPDAIFRIHFPNQERLKSIDMPVIIFVGSRDRLIPSRCSSDLASTLGNQGQFITIEAAGHKNLAAFSEYHYWLERILE